MKNFYPKSFRLLYSIVLLSAFGLTNLRAQSTDSVYKPSREFKNTIRFNVTNPLIFGGKSLIFGYERILKNNRSFSVNIGQAALPNFENGFSDEFRSNTVLSEGGFHISGDYRFYLGKLNKYSAPRGVYIGPYYSYNRFSKGHDWEYTKEGTTTPKEFNSDLSLKIQQIGFELGYQFVFWKRFSVDLILIGPGIASYKIKATAEGNLTDEERQQFFDKLNQALKDKFPGYSGTVGDGDGEFEKSGYRSTTSFGYRYMINVGYRF
ncbi:hypothetical protein [Flavobacterium nackdongense]|uniref:DUF3575 domain-containing protein n=1 Tax=Flavobacterium nackdongense TaxID=2547394 RepID=A0A4P6YAM5_9FLAO|nr:hypothetical protein [Flavobacterium nackdongense]QBN17687.1 hypothetical protein E1750_02340 [Flavobacterium nackdongense]